jgi:hypothetical protein
MGGSGDIAPDILSLGTRCRWSINIILILSFRPRKDLPNSLLPPVLVFLISQRMLHVQPFSSSFIILIIFGEECKLQCSWLCNCLHRHGISFLLGTDILFRILSFYRHGQNRNLALWAVRLEMWIPTFTLPNATEWLAGFSYSTRPEAVCLIFFLLCTFYRVCGKYWYSVCESRGHGHGVNYLLQVQW